MYQHFLEFSLSPDKVFFWLFSFLILAAVIYFLIKGFERTTSAGLVVIFALLFTLSGCLTVSQSRELPSEELVALDSSRSLALHERPAFEINRKTPDRTISTRLAFVNDQRFRDFIWLINKILSLLVVFLSSGMIGFVFFKERADQRRFRVLAAASKDIERLVPKELKDFRKTFPKIAAKIPPKQFFEMRKRWSKTFPDELTHHLKELLIASNKTPQIEKWAMSARNKWRKIEAITVLSYIDSPATLGILRRAIQDKDSEVSYFSMLALGRIRNRESASILLDFIGKHVFSGHKIASLLEQFPPSIVDELLKATESSDQTVRFWALKLLSKFGPHREWKRIVNLTEDSSPDVRAAACECLSLSGKKEAKGALLRCLKDRVWFVRMQAVRALFKIEGAECFPELIELMTKDPSSFVKESVRNAIIGDIEKALPYIEQCLESGDKSVKTNCVVALVESNYIFEILAGVLSKEPGLHKQSVRLLEGIVKSGVYFGLKKSLDVFSVPARSQLLKVIGHIDEDLVTRMVGETGEKPEGKIIV